MGGNLVVEEKEREIQRIDEIVIEYLKLVGQRIPETYVKQFIQICKAFQLNPFKREIYLIPYRDEVQIIVGYETYLKRAERSGKLSGWRVWTEGSIENGDLKAVIEIKRKDWESIFRHEVFYKEYRRDTRIWREKPITMLKKVVIAQGFRLCFPEEVGGLPYTVEECVAEDVNKVIEVETEEVYKSVEEKEEVSDKRLITHRDIEEIKERAKKVIEEKEGRKEEGERGKEEGEGMKEEWDIEKIKEVASEELKEVVRKHRVSKVELIQLFTRFNGNQDLIIDEIKRKKEVESV